jgi:hypothetical protein
VLYPLSYRRFAEPSQARPHERTRCRATHGDHSPDNDATINRLERRCTGARARTPAALVDARVAVLAGHHPVQATQ